MSPRGRWVLCLTLSAPRLWAQTAGEDEGATIRGRARSPEVHEHSVSAAEFSRMAGTRGDALLALQNLPGVARTPLGVAGFILRGSDPEDTLVTLEGHPIALPFHFQGLASTVATDLIDRVELLPGNFSVRWGRAAGGVVDVTLRAPSRESPRLSIDVDVIDAGVFASTPLGRRAQLAVGARRSYLDAVLGAVSLDGFSQAPAYWDYQMVLDAEPSARDRVRVVSAGSDDRLVFNFSAPDVNDPSLRGALGSRTSSHLVEARWRRRAGELILHSFSPAVSVVSTDISLGTDLRYSFTTTTFSFRDELSIRTGRHLNLSLGLDLQAGSTEAAITAPPLSSNGITDPVLTGRSARYAGTREFLSPAGYLEADLSPFRAMHLVTGVRVDHFGLLGATTFAPRASVRVELHPRVLVRGALGVFTTPPRGYTVLPGFGNPGLSPERWTHATLGAAIELVRDALEFSVDVFHKRGDRTAAPSSRTLTDPDGSLRPERFSNAGEARVIGAELLVRLRGPRVPLFATLSYTLQRSERRGSLDAPWVLSTWDQPQVLTALVGALAGRGWELGARFRYSSGTVEARVTGSLYDADRDVAQSFVDALNPSRLPDFFALDLRATKRWRRPWGSVQLVLELLNATNQANAESRLYSYDRRSSVIVTGLPVLPNVGLRLEL